MSNFSHDFAFLRGGQRDFDALSRAEQGEVSGLIERICRDPMPDGSLIHDIEVPPVSLSLADDERWAIVFNVVPSFVAQILGIAPSPLRDIEL